jgi:hypothetical protein
VDFGSCRNGDALDTDEFETVRRHTLNFKAQLDGFTNARGNLVQRTALGVASGELRDGGNVKALFITFNDDIELALHVMWSRFLF